MSLPPGITPDQHALHRQIDEATHHLRVALEGALRQGGDELLLRTALDSLEKIVSGSKYAIQLGIDRRETARLERIKIKS
jgi:hypothetical protein